jgi:hypothetical protein
MLPPPGQIGIRDLQEEKCQGKENGRKQVLASMVPSPGEDMNWITVTLEETSKQSAVTTMMQQVHNQYQANLATKTAKAKGRQQRLKRQMRVKRGRVNPRRQMKKAQAGLEKQFYKVAKATAIRLCGCRHGDLGEVKSFAKAMATYYSHPNKFMEGRLWEYPLLANDGYD